MPFADLSEFEKNPEVSHLSDLFTVELITRYIQGKLQRASWQLQSFSRDPRCSVAKR